MALTGWPQVEGETNPCAQYMNAKSMLCLTFSAAMKLLKVHRHCAQQGSGCNSQQVRFRGTLSLYCGPYQLLRTSSSHRLTVFAPFQFAMEEILTCLASSRYATKLNTVACCEITSSAEALLASPANSRLHVCALTLIGFVLAVPSGGRMDCEIKARLVGSVLAKLEKRVHDTYIVEACCAAISAIANDEQCRVRSAFAQVLLFCCSS